VKGKFIALEGLDGSGQSTQAELLKKWLESKKIKVILTKEPTNNLLGGIIKAVLRKELKLEQDALQLLFSADRAHHLASEIIPALEKGFWVITDRYMFSTLAFGSIEGLKMEWLNELNKNFLVPDATFFLDVKPETCIKRMESRSSRDLFEQEEILRKVRQQYLKVKELGYDKFYVLDGEKAVEQVHEQITEKIKILMD